MAGFPDYWRLRPRAPAPGALLGALADLPEATGREYVFGRGKAAFSMFAVRRAERVWGYLNICPHFSLKLNCRADNFLNPAATLIRCTMHFAEFRIEDGHCVSGACEGCCLDQVPLTVRDGRILISPGEADA
jgi:nitrite reductase/ring-hydroxylating ferredoxin subunit